MNPLARLAEAGLFENLEVFLLHIVIHLKIVISWFPRASCNAAVLAAVESSPRPHHTGLVQPILHVKDTSVRQCQSLFLQVDGHSKWHDEGQVPLEQEPSCSCPGSKVLSSGKCCPFYLQWMSPISPVLSLVSIHQLRCSGFSLTRPAFQPPRCQQHQWHDQRVGEVLEKQPSSAPWIEAIWKRKQNKLEIIQAWTHVFCFSGRDVNKKSAMDQQVNLDAT